MKKNKFLLHIKKDKEENFIILLLDSLFYSVILPHKIVLTSLIEVGDNDDEPTLR